MNATKEMGSSRCFAWNFMGRTPKTSGQMWSTDVVERSGEITNRIQIFIAQKEKGEGWNPQLRATVSLPESGFSDCHHTSRGSFKGYGWRGSSSKAFNELWVKKKTTHKTSQRQKQGKGKISEQTSPQGLLPWSGNLPATLPSATLSHINLLAGSFIAAPMCSKQWGTSYHKVSNLELQFLSVQPGKMSVQHHSHFQAKCFHFQISATGSEALTNNGSWCELREIFRGINWG